MRKGAKHLHRDDDARVNTTIPREYEKFYNLRAPNYLWGFSWIGDS